MALERIPADIRADGGVARMSDPQMIAGIKAAVTIPVMAKSRIGHFVECQILQEIGADYIDESEVLTMADEDNHTNKHKFTVPFVCGCRNLGEALRRVAEGAAMIRTKGEAGTGNVVEVPCPLPLLCARASPSPSPSPLPSPCLAPPFRDARLRPPPYTHTQAVRHARTLLREIKKVPPWLRTRPRSRSPPGSFSEPSP